MFYEIQDWFLCIFLQLKWEKNCLSSSKTMWKCFQYFLRSEIFFIMMSTFLLQMSNKQKKYNHKINKKFILRKQAKFTISGFYNFTSFIHHTSEHKFWLCCLFYLTDSIFLFFHCCCCYDRVISVVKHYIVNKWKF